MKWIVACNASELGVEEVLSFEAGDNLEIAVYRLEDGDLAATDGICTHEYARLCEGWLEGDEVECPLHAGRFNVRTGKALCAPLDTDIRTFPVREEGGEILVGIPDAG